MKSLKCHRSNAQIMLDVLPGLGMASPNSAFTTMVTTFGLSGIVGK